VTPWPVRPLDIAGAPSDIQAWRLDLDLRAAIPDDASRLLDEQEHARMRRYQRHEDQLRFAVTRASLKCLLAGMTARAHPSSVSFTYTARGKPEWRDAPVHFNVSHSGGIACIVISDRREVGVDVETLRDLDVAPLIDNVLTAGERDILRRFPEPRRRLAFYDYWVCKEAALKAVGMGIGESLQRIAIVPADNDSTPSRVDCDPLLPDHAILQSMRLRMLDIPGDYAGAIAWAGQP
jgi:4'-phosphopantetheinyl transferase